MVVSGVTVMLIPADVAVVCVKQFAAILEVTIKETTLLFIKVVVVKVAPVAPEIGVPLSNHW